MLTDFSSGYYLARLYVEPAERERAAMHRKLLELANEQLYAGSEGIERLDNPLIVKLDTGHFPVYGDDEIPEGTLDVPELFLPAGIRNPPALMEVLVAKAQRSAQLLQLSGLGLPDPR